MHSPEEYRKEDTQQSPEESRKEGSTTPWWRSLTSFSIVGLLKRSYLVIFLGAAVMVGAFASPFFFSFRNIENILVTGAVVSILAIAQFTVIVTRGIDLSVGSVAALGTVTVAGLLQQGQPVLLVILVTLAVCGAMGLINGFSVVYAGITPFIATFAMLSIARGLAYVVQQGTLIEVSNATFLSLFTGNVLGIPNAIIIVILITVIAAFIAAFTTFGRQLYAIGGNPEAARLSGLPVNRTLVMAYVISGALAGLAGLILAAQLRQGSSLLGVGYELDSIAAAVVGGTSLFGGTGNPISAVLGGILIGIISNIMDLVGINSEPQLIILGTVILIAVFFTSGEGTRRLRQLTKAFRSGEREGSSQ